MVAIVGPRGRNGGSGVALGAKFELGTIAAEDGQLSTEYQLSIRKRSRNTGGR
jgi:hypothetical protein